jgi:ribosome maturation factor RimP
MTRTMDLLWQREARVHVGRHVQITVANSQDVAGKLVEATEDGLLIEQTGGATVAITYRRVQGIEPLASV